MKESLPLISIITVNYNQYKATFELIESLQNVTYPNIEIIVVDNNSQEKDIIDITKHFEFVVLIESKRNIGFAGGNNMGIKRANGEYILLLNNDTIVEPDFLEPLIQTLINNPSIGAVSPKIKYYDNPEVVQYAGFTQVNPYTIRIFTIGIDEKDRGQHNTPGQTAFTHGAAMLVPIKVIRQVGLMDEQYFLYYEEHDWCMRMRKNGYIMYYQPKSVIYHKDSLTTSRNNYLKTYYIHRNRLLFAIKHAKGFLLIINILYLTIIVIIKNTIKFLLQWRLDLAKAIWAGLFWHINNIFSKKNN